MNKMARPSRRQLVMALSTAPIAASGAARASVSTDAELIELGSQLDEVAAQLDAATPANVIGWDVLNRFGEIYDKILTTDRECRWLTSESSFGMLDPAW